MIGAESSPGRFERLIRQVPEGTVLRIVFWTLLSMAIGVAGLDLRAMLAADANTGRVFRTEPMPLARPAPGDQVRPYLPRTIPVGPDRGEPKLPGYDGPVDGEAMAKPMAFIDAGGGTVTAIGRIEVGTADIFRRMLDASSEPIDRLVLHSPGGSVGDALAMARLVRERRIETQVPADGYCASACPLLFAGGALRRAGEGAWIGVHQVYALPTSADVGTSRDVDRSIASVQATIAECQQLLIDMGVDPKLWIAAMRTPPEQLYVLTPQEMTAFKLTTREPFGPPMPPGRAT